MSARSTRRRSRLLVAAAAAAVLGAAMPLFTGASAAWACGDGGTAAVAPATPTAPAPTGAANAAPAAGGPATAVHKGESTIAYLPGTPDTITAGGSPIELQVEMANFTGAAYDDLRPTLGFYDMAAGGTNLRPEDFTVQVMTGGQWKTLPVHHGCDPVIYPDTSGLAQHLDAGRASRLMFRVALSGKAPADQHDITVFLGTAPGGQGPVRTLHIVRPDAPTSAPASAPARTATGTPTKSAPAAVPTAAPTQAAVRPAAATSPAAVPTTATATPQQLAFTGGGASSGLLLGAGGALVVLGAGAVTMAARRRSTGRH
ncbi:hypothetical protein ABH930_004259 [Kitasatospora sp. GAS204A]|uniref:hypothetical protein n=1 Tax=unclassified Kitasatospora TaxID=2633591 RepID=UPI002473E72E|nr:hypothetical protein [Kitasatospora sp. GAS204B]MDH6119502.1 hypothetical protein [Kitasatospora sp. GAS204B]